MLFPALVSWLLVYFDELPLSLQSDNWLNRWACWVEEAIAELFGSVTALAVILLMPIAALIVVLELFGGWLLGLLGLIVTVIALIYACGRDNYAEQIHTYKKALSVQTDANTHQAYNHHLFYRQAIYTVYQRWFVIMIWFLLLGIAGAVFYRLCYLLSRRKKNQMKGENDQEQDLNGSLAETCATLVSWLDWLPLRLWVLIVAAATNFSTVFAAVKPEFFGAGEHGVLLDKAIAAWLENTESNAMQEQPGEEPTAKIHPLEVVQQTTDRLETLANSCMVFGLGFVLILMIVF